MQWHRATICLRWCMYWVCNMYLERQFKGRCTTLNFLFLNFAVYGFWDDRRAPLLITYNGTVEWGPSFNGKTSCGMFVVYYPFDHHYCKIVFGTWFSHSEDIVLIPARSKAMKQAGWLLDSCHALLFCPFVPSRRQNLHLQCKCKCACDAAFDAERVNRRSDFDRASSCIEGHG